METPLTPQEGGAIPSERLVSHTSYEVVTKDSEGEAQIHTLHARRYVADATPASFISQADPVNIQPAEIRTHWNDVDKVIVLPDMQCGFRNYNGELEPIHSEESIDVALQIVRDVQPEQVVLNGDNIDFTTISKHLPEHHFHDTLKPTINYVHQLLAKIRASAPNTKITYLAGNHEQRLEKYVASKAPELYELTQAGSDQRMLTVPFLLNLNAIGNVEYVSGYPAGEYWLSDDLKAIHGNKARPTGATAPTMLRDHNESVVFGHIHRIEIAAKTIAARNAGRLAIAASFGTLANIEGKVPSYGSSVDDTGHAVRHVEQWQNGLGYIEMSRKTGRVALMQPIIIDTFNPEMPYSARFNGRTYIPNGKQ